MISNITYQWETGRAMSLCPSSPTICASTASVLHPFWSAFIHVLRDAVDHAEQSVIRAASAMEGDRFVVTTEDDGPGVDWERLRTKAGELGIADTTLVTNP